MLLSLLACTTPTCPAGEAFDADGLCVLDTGADADTDTDADTDADGDTDTDTDTTYPFDLYVCPTGTGGDYATVQEGVDAALAGQVVGVCPAWYHECVVVEKDLTLRSSSGGDTTWIDGELGCPSVTVRGAAVGLDGLSLIDGTAALVVEAGTVTADEVYFRDHLADDAVIVVDGGALTLGRGWMADNVAAAGIRLVSGTLTLNRTEFTNDLGDDFPVVVAVDAGTATLNNPRFFGDGAGTFVRSAAPTQVSNAVFLLGPDRTGVDATGALVVQNSIFSGAGVAVRGAATLRYTDFWEVEAEHCTEACGAAEGEGLLRVDPELTDSGRRLTATSPCVDAGDPDPAWNDLDGTRNDLGSSGGPMGEP